jgi:hypothetical protein
MRNLLIAVAAVALAAVPVLAAEATFERTLTVNGVVDLTVATGAGNVHLIRGSANQVRIVGKVRSNWSASEQEVRDVAAHPPIEQTGNIIRIGGRRQDVRNISIDYEIQAPADSYLDVGSGSGNVVDDGVGKNAKLHTGSGNINGTSLQGGFSLGTGSGNIEAAQGGPGDVKASTGSGNIGLKNLRGGLHASTGSGDIKVEGTPASAWKLETGSGSVELWTGNAAFTLDASTGSGSIRTDRQITMQGESRRHRVRGDISGGGPIVRVSTGSGDIRVH